MNVYKLSKKDPMSRINQFLEDMGEIEYGWLGTDGKKYYDPEEDGEEYEEGNAWWNTYVVMSPEEVRKNKIGTCIDQTILEKEWFDKNLPSVPTKVIWVQQFKNHDHMFLVFELDNKWYWFEHSWGHQKGIHGPFDSIDDIISDFKETDELKIKVMDDFKWKEGMSADIFLEKMDYEFDKEDWGINDS